MTPEAIVSEHLHFTLTDIYTAMTYYHDHREAINAETVGDREWYEEQREKQTSRLKDALKARNTHGTDETLPPG